jgi:hypothetical protein
MKKLFISIFLIVFIGCGYKPTSIYTKKLLGDKIFVDVKISLQDPENSVLIRDSINRAVIDTFKARVVSKKEATSSLYIELKKVLFMPIQYDKNGYVIAYKTNVTLSTDYTDKFRKSSKIISEGDFDFPIESNSVISDNKRFEAIKNASSKALDAFISKLSIRGI